MFKWLTIAILIALVPNSNLLANDNDRPVSLAPAEEKRVTDLVSFVELLFNTVGSKDASRQEKETIITETYLKAFSNEEAKIEDDLHQRDVIINKDIQNYLRDVDIFFNDVEFDFSIKSIEQLSNNAGKTYYKAKVIRSLKGTTFNTESVSNDLERYIEINVNDNTQEYKIASIYNVETNNRLTLQEWWKDLSFEWKVIFQRKLQREISAGDATKLFGIDELDISYNRYVKTLEPLNVLVNLKKLNISNTTVRDLTPLGGLSELEELYLSNTIVKDLGMIRGLPSLKVLSFESTEVSDIGPLLKHPGLKKIVCTNTGLNPDQVKELKQKLSSVEVLAEAVTLSKWWRGLSTAWQDVFRDHVTMLKLEPNTEELDQISQIKKLDISGRMDINDLSPIKAIENLEEFNASKSGIYAINELSKMKNLKKVIISDTYVNSIAPLESFNQLELLNVDYSSVEETEATNFMINHPKTLVIYNSIKLIPAWLKLSPTWKKFLEDQVNYDGSGTMPLDQLFEIINLKELDISDRQDLADLGGLQVMPGLKKLNISKLMTVSDLEVVAHLKGLEELDVSFNPIESLTPLTQLPKLKTLNIENTKVAELSALQEVKTLTSIQMSSTKIKNLNDLRALRLLEEVEFNNTSVGSLSPLITLRFLKEVSCFNTKLTEKDVKELKSARPDCKVVFY